MYNGSAKLGGLIYKGEKWTFSLSLKVLSCDSLVSGAGLIILAEIDSMELEITLEKNPCSKN